MKCQNEDGCDGHLNFDRPVKLMAGCASYRNTIPCEKCGRLHFAMGDLPEASPVCNRQGHRAFLEDGVVVNKDENGVEQSRL